MSVTNKLVHEHEWFAWEVHRKGWLQTELLHVNNQGRNLVGKHLGCYWNGVASQERHGKSEDLG